MKKYSWMAAVAIFFSSAHAAYAAPTCAATARVATSNYPGAAAIPTGNNLLKPAGKAVEAEGQPLTLQGVVRDRRCAPVAGAVVELWQSNPFGRWLLAEPRDIATPEPTFAGAGRTYTDQEGRFTFVTAFPAPIGKRAPMLNIKLSGEAIKPVSTALFLGSDSRNEADSVYKKLSPKAREDVTIIMRASDDGSWLGNIEIVLEGAAPFRTY
jgi:protocatechuate 3,4-dioxygenase, beta subunit